MCSYTSIISPLVLLKQQSSSREDVGMAKKKKKGMSGTNERKKNNLLHGQKSLGLESVPLQRRRIRSTEQELDDTSQASL